MHTVQDASKAAGALLAKGVGNVIVTLGSEGALIRTPAEELLIPARTVTPVDTTAAGDVFNGALLVARGLGDVYKRQQRLGLGDPHGRTGLDTVARGAGDPRLNRTKTLKLKYYVRC